MSDIELGTRDPQTVKNQTLPSGGDLPIIRKCHWCYEIILGHHKGGGDLSLWGAGKRPVSNQGHRFWKDRTLMVLL